MITVGQILNDTFKVTEQLGSGGGGIVFKAYHLRLEKYVAVKLIKEDVREHINQRAETDILKNLKHESLPQVYDFVVDGEDVYTVMEYIDGSSLFDVIAKNRKLSYKKSLEWARQLCSAAAYLHTRKPTIIHSDIKPQNIMITSEGKLCLIDFNISSVFGEGIYTVGSSDGYSPPEQYLARPTAAPRNPSPSASGEKTEILRGSTEILSDSNSKQNTQKDNTESKIDTRSDVYSIGAVMYSMITGRKPENSRTEVTPLGKIDENIPESYIYITEKAMQKNKSDRFESAAEMLKALDSINRLDRRYRSMRARHMAGYLLCLFLFTGSVISAIQGYDLMNKESGGKLAEYVKQMDEMGEKNDFSDFDSLYSAVISEYPESPVPHYYKAYIMYGEKKFDETEDYIKKNLLARIKDLPQDKRSDVYFMLADIYCRNDDYENAASMYSEAIGFNPENPDIYRDYAVALARLNDTEKAKQILDMAVSRGLTEDGIYSVTGEIQFVRGEYSEALESMKKAIELTDNDDIKRNSYFIAVKAYDALIGNGSDALMQEKIAMLEKAYRELPLEMGGGYIQEYLAQAYIDYGRFSDKMEYYAKAAELLSHVLDDMKMNGRRNYLTEMNIAVLLDKLGDVKGARNILKEMLEVPEYEQNYFIIYVRLAYCEGDIQSKLEIRERDYSEFDKYFRCAENAYDEYKEQHGSDPEMEKLRQYRSDLVSYGLLEP